MSESFAVKDSGKRQEFASGMVRDVTTGKIDYSLVLDGPMFDRWAVHLTKGAEKYAKRNWMQANGEEERARFKESALRHFLQWYRDERDEDHAAAVLFNINGAEYVRQQLAPANTATTVVDLNYPELRAIYEEDVECVWRDDLEAYQYHRNGVFCCNDAYNNCYLCTLPADHTGKHCATDLELSDHMREWN